MAGLLAALPEILTIIAAIIGAITALVQALKARRYHVAMGKSQEALDALQAGIALLPDGPDKTRLENTVARISQGLSDHGETLANTAQEVADLLSRYGLLTTGDDTANAVKAGDVVRAYRKDVAK